MVWPAGQLPHKRRNPLTGEWVLVSAQRLERPWQGSVEPIAQTSSVAYDPECYLCSGNLRAKGKRNPDYAGTFIFDNDFPVLFDEDRAGPYVEETARDLLVTQPERGISRVLCFSPRHDLSLGRMPREQIRGVVEAWCEESKRLAALPWIKSIQIFENRGAIMGASNPHPHGQIWASESLPNEHRKELDSQLRYRAEHHRCLLCDYLTIDTASERLIFENDSYAVIVPFWAVWPFETIVIPKGHCAAMDDLTPREREDLADALKRLTTRYDNLFEAPFPYSMGFHQRPFGGEADESAQESWNDSCHLHAHFYPPLLRSATVRKFLVGYEMLAMPQRDLTAETAAKRLRGCSEVHYLDRGARGT